MREIWETTPGSDKAKEALRSKVIPDFSHNGEVPIECHREDQLAKSAISQHHIEAFTNMVLAQTEDTLLKQFDVLLGEGKSVDVLFSRLLVGCAQHLGEMWEDDACSFGDVTLGLSVLHRLLHKYSGSLNSEIVNVLGDPSVLVTPLPGETHIFAASLLATYFRAAQWRVYSGIDEGAATLFEMADDHYLDILVVTVSCDAKVVAAEKLIRQIKDHSCNQDLTIMVGGPPFLLDPCLHEAIGADFTAPNAITALNLAKQCVLNKTHNVF